MKISANAIKTGMIIEHNNDLWEVLKTQHVKPGKGGAFNQVVLKSINKNTKLNERFRSNDTIEKAILDEKKYNFLFEDSENYHFMDQVSYEQILIKKSKLCYCYNCFDSIKKINFFPFCCSSWFISYWYFFYFIFFLY